jgi:putative ABC transport system ATP-binding protein
MTTAQPLIHVTAITKYFQMGQTTVKALNGVNLDIQRNSFTLIMGPSGSGKSTLLYLLGGLDRPTSGEISVDGLLIDSIDENELARYRRDRVGFVFQSFNLIPSMTALENVAFPMRFSRVARKQRLKKAFELLESVGLADRAHHKPSELSGGQQQRVAIARALVHNPNLILADEPTGNLDSAGGLLVMKSLKDLHLAGSTIIVVTHDNRNRQFATDIRYILDGVIVNEDEYLDALSITDRSTSD